jgi:hypothetical protein
MNSDRTNTLKKIIESSFEEVGAVKKTFVGTELKDSTKAILNKIFNLESNEIILLAGYYTIPGSKLGLIITDQNFHYRTNRGFFGFAKTSSQALDTIYSLNIGFMKGRGEGLRADTAGSDLVINGLGSGSFGGWSLPDKDERLLSVIFKKISELNLTKFGKEV